MENKTTMKTISELDIYPAIGFDPPKDKITVESVPNKDTWAVKITIGKENAIVNAKELEKAIKNATFHK